MKLMKMPTVILIGFSTAGKSFYLDKIRNESPDSAYYLDSDKFLSETYDGHIFNIFMMEGRSFALQYIADKEKEFLQVITTANDDKPQLIAAGPFLVQRHEEWERFIRERNPYVIHLKKNVESIYNGLLDRRERQKEELDISNPNFGSWDKDVTTELVDGKYQDLPKAKSLENIKFHLERITPVYERYQNYVFDSDLLKKNPEESNELIKLIRAKLHSEATGL